ARHEGEGRDLHPQEHRVQEDREQDAVHDHAPLAEGGSDLPPIEGPRRMRHGSPAVGGVRRAGRVADGHGRGGLPAAAQSTGGTGAAGAAGGASVGSQSHVLCEPSQNGLRDESPHRQREYGRPSGVGMRWPAAAYSGTSPSTGSEPRAETVILMAGSVTWSVPRLPGDG